MSQKKQMPAISIGVSGPVQNDKGETGFVADIMLSGKLVQSWVCKTEDPVEALRYAANVMEASRQQNEKKEVIPLPNNDHRPTNPV